MATMGPPFPSPLPLDGTSTPHNRHAPPNAHPTHLSALWPCLSSLRYRRPALHTKSSALAGQPSSSPLRTSDGSTAAAEAKAVQGITVGGEDGIPHTPWEWLVDIQEGHVEKEGRAVRSHQHWTSLSVHNLNTNTTSQWHQHQHQHCIPMILTPHPNDTDIAFWWQGGAPTPCLDDTDTLPWGHQYCVPMTLTSHPNDTNTIATFTIVDICSYSNVVHAEIESFIHSLCDCPVKVQGP